MVVDESDVFVVDESVAFGETHVPQSFLVVKVVQSSLIWLVGAYDSAGFGRWHTGCFGESSAGAEVSVGFGKVQTGCFGKSLTGVEVSLGFGQLQTGCLETFVVGADVSLGFGHVHVGGSGTL